MIMKLKIIVFHICFRRFEKNTDAVKYSAKLFLPFGCSKTAGDMLNSHADCRERNSRKISFTIFIVRTLVNK